MRDHTDLPEQRASTGLPLSIMLSSVLMIATYLIVGNSLVANESRTVTMYASQASPIPAGRLP